MNIKQHGRQLLGLIGAVTMAALVTFSGPVGTAQAASRPDFKASLVRHQFADRANQEFQYMATFGKTGAASGPAVLTFWMQEGFGKPSVQATPGYVCSTKYTDGILPGWMVECSSRAVGNHTTETLDFIMVTVRTPSKPGEYAMIASIWPEHRADEADESDNIANMKVSIR